jgi:dihydrofolate synthase/folylpolyglutamate synthase
MPDFAYLERFANFEKDPGTKRDFHLENMRRLLSDFHNPHEGIELVHIAGSKGKGSTAAYLAALLAAEREEAVGVYGSPHVFDYRERIRASLPFEGDYKAGFFPDEAYDHALALIRQYMDKPDSSATTFELLTLMAFLVFRSADIRFAVIEVGLGGRLDSTNVIQPLLSVITPIELEHQKYLGDTIAEIAGEKAGIIKPGIPVISGKLVPEALDVVRRRAEQQGSAWHSADECLENFNLEYPASMPESAGALTAARMTGSPARDNALLAYTAWHLLRKQTDTPGGERSSTVENETIPGMVSKAFDELLMPGRYELRKIPLSASQSAAGADDNHSADNLDFPLLLDAAHTPQSMSALLSVLDSLGSDFSADRLTVIFSCLTDKDHRALLKLLMPRCKQIYLTGTGNFKRSDVDAIEKAALELADATGCRVFRRDSPEDILTALSERAPASEQPGGVLATGSFYLLGEIYRAIKQFDR